MPEGEVVELVSLDEVLAQGGDYLDDEERAAQGLADVRRAARWTQTSSSRS